MMIAANNTTSTSLSVPFSFERHYYYQSVSLTPDYLLDAATAEH